MPVVEDSIVINREPKEVWDFATDLDNVEVVDSSQSDVRKLTDGPTDVGTRISGVSRVLGRKIPYVTECTAMEAPRHVHWEAIESPVHFTLDYRYEAVDGGTRMTARVESESGLGGFFGKFTDALVARTYAKQMRANLETAKELLEGGG